MPGTQRKKSFQTWRHRFWSPWFHVLTPFLKSGNFNIMDWKKGKQYIVGVGLILAYEIYILCCFHEFMIIKRCQLPMPTFEGGFEKKLLFTVKLLVVSVWTVLSTVFDRRVKLHTPGKQTRNLTSKEPVLQHNFSSNGNRSRRLMMKVRLSYMIYILDLEFFFLCRLWLVFVFITCDIFLISRFAPSLGHSKNSLLLSTSRPTKLPSEQR